MATDLRFITQTDLETAITGEKVRELLADTGKQVRPERWQLVSDSAHGFVLRKLKIGLNLDSLDQWWVKPEVTDRDRGEVRRMVLQAAIYWAHYYGQKAEGVPPDVNEAYQRLADEIDEFAKHMATIGANTSPATNTQNDLLINKGPGYYIPTGARSRWGNF